MAVLTDDTIATPPGLMERLRPLLDDYPAVPRLALTATADRHTRADILTQLGIPPDGLILAGFDRPNIRYAIAPRDGLPVIDVLPTEEVRGRTAGQPA